MTIDKSIRTVLLFYSIFLFLQSCTKQDIKGDKIIIDENGLMDIYIYDIVNNTNKKITDTPAIYESGYSFSTDSKRILFNQENETWQMNLDGSQQNLLIEDTNMASMSPNGQQIAFSRDEKLYLTNANGSSIRQLTDSLGIWNPHWSTDGKYLAGSSYNGVFLIDMDGNIKTITESPFTDFYDWSSDSAKVIFTDNAGSASNLSIQIFWYDRLEDKVEQLTNEVYTESAYFIPATDEIVYVSTTNSGFPNTIQLLEKDGCCKKQILQWDKIFFQNVSPDGEHIAFIDGNGNVAIVGLSGNNFRTINERSGACFWPKWSPDGKYLLYYRGIFTN